MDWAGPDPRSADNIQQMQIIGEDPDEGFEEWLQEVGGILQA